MPRKGSVSRKSTVAKVGTEIRHQYESPDVVSGDIWKVSFALTDPEVSVLLDRGTFEWLWDFVARKGRQADAPNFHYSDIHRDVYQRAANQFAVAAKEAFGDTYRVQETKKSSKKVTEEPAEAPVEPSKPRRRRKRVSETAETFQPSESPTEVSKTIRRRKRRSRAT